MKRFIEVLAVTALFIALAASPASADFGVHEFDVTFTDSGGSPSMLAGSHPFEMTTSFELNTVEEGGKEFIDGGVKDLEFLQAEGFSGNPTATPRCSTVDFLTPVGLKFIPACADSTAVGFAMVTLGTSGENEEVGPFPVFNLEPSPGVAGKFGFWVQEVRQTVEVGLSPDPPYRVVASLANVSQAQEVVGSRFILWGNPADPAHDSQRGICLKDGGSCPANVPVRPLITLPRSCEGPLVSTMKGLSWWSGDPGEPGPGTFFEAFAETHDGFEPPGPLGTSGCGKLGFAPRVSVQPTTDAADSPTGLDVSLEINDDGLTNPTGIAHSDIISAVVALPEGVTANPSLAEGLATCSVEDLERETVQSGPGEGCPEASKIGTVEVETPILEEKILKGNLFIATQDDPTTTEPGRENPFDSLLALYMVIKDRELGIILKLPGLIEPDPTTGQLVTVFDELPQQPVSDFRLHLREGGRSPLISPSTCGTYTTVAELFPSGDPEEPFVATSSFKITSGVGGAPCPPAGTPPFDPGFAAGSVNNNAGAYSPFNMRLTRRDGDQDLTRFDVTLPPGMVAKLAGTTQCPDASIALAKAKRGREELAAPSCPPSSEIGRVLGGAGAGSQLTYVPGKLYLAGPFGGAPLSAVGIVPAVAGPFDVGTVVVRQALQVNPQTAEVRVDGAHSDPIPHILAGIPLRVRDVRAYVDRPQFTLNPTSCERFNVAAQIWGGGIDPFSRADDAPVPRSARFQAADCASLGFKPRLSLNLEGGARRGDHPALEAVLRPRPGDANLKRAVVRLPRSAFLDQAHIRTICTRVQFAADACPKGAVYGQVKAFTPILDQPLQGPVYLRSSNNELPDLVFDLHGLIDVEAVGRIDSQKGGIRATFNDTPDAPISKVVVEMQGGKKGLIVNSRNLCAAPSRADLRFSAHNAKRRHLRPLVRASGCGAKRPKR